MEISEIISEEGLKISGQGILIKELEKLTKIEDRRNALLSFIEKKLEKHNELLEKQNDIQNKRNEILFNKK